MDDHVKENLACPCTRLILFDLLKLYDISFVQIVISGLELPQHSAFDHGLLLNDNNFFFRFLFLALGNSSRQTINGADILV